MSVLQARVVGYQSFGDSGDVEFEPGINLVVGRNNAGKSAFLRALQTTFADDRHRTAERWEPPQLAVPEVYLTLEATGLELEMAIRNIGDARIPAPFDQDAIEFTKLVTAHLPPPDNASRAILARNHGFGGRKLAQNPRNQPILASLQGGR